MARKGQISLFSLSFMQQQKEVVTHEFLLCTLPGPQSPCERTDLRMAIVADHLGLSWTGNYTAFSEILFISRLMELLIG